MVFFSMVYSETLGFFGNLALLNTGYFAGLIGNNIVWLFIFIAMAFFIFPNKNMFFGMAFLLLVLFASNDLVKIMDWVLFDPKFLAINTFASIGVLAFAENDERLKKHFGLINTLRFVTVLSVFNLFLR